MARKSLSFINAALMTSLAFPTNLTAEDLNAMFKVEALIQPHKLDEACATLAAFEIPNVIVTEARDHGASAIVKSIYRGSEWSAAPSRIKIEVLVSSLLVDDVVDALLSASRSQTSMDDGTVVVYPVADAIRIRDGERAAYCQ
jgi:nitrogen regulatory protein P-II 1